MGCLCLRFAMVASFLAVLLCCCGLILSSGFRLLLFLQRVGKKIGIMSACDSMEEALTLVIQQGYHD